MNYFRHTLSAILSCVCIAGVQAADKPVVTVSAYGINQAAFEKHLFGPFRKQCGCDVVVETGNAADRLAKLEAYKNDPRVDLIVFTDAAALDAKNKGLLSKWNVDKLKNYKDLFDFAKDPIGDHFAVGYTVFGVGIVYRSDKIKTPIASWKDLFRPELKGRITLPNITTSTGPLTLFMIDQAYGASPKFQNGLKQIAANKADIVTFVDKSAQLATLFAQEEIWAAPVGRFAWINLVKTGLPLKWVVPSEGQAGGINVLGLVKGAKNTELAYQLADLWLSKEIQSAFANDVIDSPVNKLAQVQPDKQDMLTYGDGEIKALRFIKPATVLADQNDWINSWNKALSK